MERGETSAESGEIKRSSLGGYERGDQGGKGEGGGGGGERRGEEWMGKERCEGCVGSEEGRGKGR